MINTEYSFWGTCLTAKLLFLCMWSSTNPWHGLMVLILMNYKRPSGPLFFYISPLDFYRCSSRMVSQPTTGEDEVGTPTTHTLMDARVLRLSAYTGNLWSSLRKLCSLIHHLPMLHHTSRVSLEQLCLDYELQSPFGFSLSLVFLANPLRLWEILPLLWQFQQSFAS